MVPGCNQHDSKGQDNLQSEYCVKYLIEEFMTKKILITGFEPFDNDFTNPSGDWIKWMETRNTGKDVRGEILPVSFSGAFNKFKKVYDEFCPDIVILTGLAKNRAQLTIERIGINWVDARIPDNDGITLSAQKIDLRGPDGLFTTLPIESVMKSAEASGHPMKLSTSAGEYVCNDLLYKTLCYTLGRKIPVTFVHLPGADNYDGIYLALESVVKDL